MLRRQRTADRTQTASTAPRTVCSLTARSQPHHSSRSVGQRVRCAVRRRTASLRVYHATHISDLPGSRAVQSMTFINP